MAYQQTLQVEPTVSPAPPAFYEYGFYAVMTYAHLGLAWGLNVPSMGATALVLLAVACLVNVRFRIVKVFIPIGFALCCGVSVIAVQVAIHSDDSFAETTPFMTWLIMLIIVRTLSLREGFLHRFALAALGMGLLTLPFLSFDYGDGAIRASVRGTGLSNPNVLALWFGFCYVYFLVLGIETRTLAVRVVAWSIACGCLYVVGITVSRGALLGLAAASVIAFQRSLKQSAFLTLFLVLVSSIVYQSGLFDSIMDFFVERGTQETGREILWPLAFQRFLDSPWEGVGLAQSYMTLGSKLVGPHNGFLYIALACGLVPLAFFLAYMVHAGWGAFHADPKRSPDAPFLPPLFVLALVKIIVSDESFMSLWIIVALTCAVSTTHSFPRERLLNPEISSIEAERMWTRRASGIG